MIDKLLNIIDWITLVGSIVAIIYSPELEQMHINLRVELREAFLAKELSFAGQALYYLMHHYYGICIFLFAAALRFIQPIIKGYALSLALNATTGKKD